LQSQVGTTGKGRSEPAHCVQETVPQLRSRNPALTLAVLPLKVLATLALVLLLSILIGIFWPDYPSPDVWLEIGLISWLPVLVASVALAVAAGKRGALLGILCGALFAWFWAKKMGPAECEGYLFLWGFVYVTATALLWWGGSLIWKFRRQHQSCSAVSPEKSIRDEK